MKNLDSLLFPTFKIAAEELNFTRAADRLGTTQSNISQQIAKIEDQLGALVFFRINKALSLSPAGEKLLRFINEYEVSLEKFSSEFSEERELKGSVRYAMPHSCLFTPHFGMFLEQIKSHTELSVDVSLCSNEEVVKKLFSRQIDFGFVTKEMAQPGLLETPFAAEEYVCAGSKKWVDKIAESDLTELHWIEYPGMRELFDIWKDGQFSRKKKLNSMQLKYAGRINSLHGAIDIMVAGKGLTIVPRHVISEELAAKKIVVWKSSEKIESPIFVVTLMDVLQPKRVEFSIAEFLKMKSK
ncbi:MAG: LysR family transcriptional regulator [Pseudobdellovibrionaceae bacterium]